MKKFNIFKKIFILLVVVITGFIFVNQANALTVSDQDGNASSCPDKYPYNTGSCSIFIKAINVNGFNDTDTSYSARRTPVEGEYIIPGKTIKVSWQKTGDTPGAYLVRFGCGDSIDFANDSYTIGWTTSTSINWSVPTWVTNYKYCKVWVYAEEKNGNTTNNPTLGVSNTRAFEIEEEADPISVACYVSPSRADVNEEVRIYAEVSGGTPSYSYSWSGDAYGSSKTIYKTFSTSGTKRFQVRVTDSKNQTKTAECSVFIEEEEANNDRYDCNWSTYQCNPSSLGQFANYADCYATCQRPVDNTRYDCNWATYQCNRANSGQFASYSDCYATCQRPVSNDRYDCNWATYQCLPSSLGEFDSMAACTSICRQPFEQTRYTCNRSTYSCSVSNGGEYNSYQACASECVDTTPRYVCNLETYTCEVAANGGYTSYTECYHNCQAPAEKYSCNESTGQCYVDANGTYTNINTCKNNCNVEEISVDLTANPTNINRGQSSLLSWTSNNATYCVASNGWSGNKSTHGSETVTPSITTTYTITCYNGSNSASDTVTVTVNDVNPSVDLYVYPSTIYIGQTAMLSWNANNVHSCYASNGWSGSKSTYGNESVSPSVTTTYTITCTGTNGSTVSDTVVLNVLSQQTDKVLTITKLARNLSNGDRTYNKVINAKKGDVIEFYLLISNIHSTKYSNNTAVIDRLPAPLSYYAGTTKIDNISNVDGIATTGLNLGTLRPSEKRVITFQAIANQAGTYYTITNTAEAEGDNISTVSDTATITYTAVLGASTIATGPMETGMLVGGLSVLITTSAWVYTTRTEKGKQLLKNLEEKRIQKRINDLKN